MKKYIGTKMIEAKPMNRGDYNAYRGWPIPENENPADEGYLVVYTDSDNYESWSPKDVFDRAYRSCDGGMTFGGALELLKMGFKVARKGWNGKKQDTKPEEWKQEEIKRLNARDGVEVMKEPALNMEGLEMEG